MSKAIKVILSGERSANKVIYVEKENIDELEKLLLPTVIKGSMYFSTKAHVDKVLDILGVDSNNFYPYDLGVKVIGYVSNKALLREYNTALKNQFYPEEAAANSDSSFDYGEACDWANIANQIKTQLLERGIEV